MVVPFLGLSQTLCPVYKVPLYKGYPRVKQEKQIETHGVKIRSIPYLFSVFPFLIQRFDLCFITFFCNRLVVCLARAWPRQWAQGPTVLTGQVPRESLLVRWAEAQVSVEGAPPPTSENAHVGGHRPVALLRPNVQHCVRPSVARKAKTWASAYSALPFPPICLPMLLLIFQRIDFGSSGGVFFFEPFKLLSNRRFVVASCFLL